MRYGQLQVPGHGLAGEYEPNEYFMQLAIDQASVCVEQGQHPVGAVVTRTEGVLNLDVGEKVPYEFIAGVGSNMTENSSASHAEVVAIQDAEGHHGRRRLHNLKSVLYTTHEPCPMCAGLIANSKLHGVVYGTNAQDAAALVRDEGIKWRSNQVSGLDIIRGRVENGVSGQFIMGGFMREQCMDLLRTAGRLGIAK